MQHQSITIIIKECGMADKTVSINITIRPAGGGGGTPITIDASGVPTSGDVGVPFTGALSVSGGVPPYSFSLASGALPDGVSLMSDGSFSGTPTKDGSFSFVVDVADSSVAA